MFHNLNNKLFRGLSLAVVLAMMIAPLAFADNVQNDVVAGGNDTINSGGSTTVNYRITANNGDDENGCNATVASPAVVTINAPAGVTANPSLLTFTACSVNQSVTFTSSTVGDHDITVSVSDSGPGTYNTNPAKFALHVLAPPPPSDTTPPVITPNVSGTLGNNGWYTSDVTVSWSVVDSESTISSSNGCDPSTISTDTTGITLTCSATSAGGTNSASVTVKRDATAPTISGSASPAANGAGWNNTDVTVSFTCNDNLSGVASCGPDQTLSGEGAGQSASGTAVDDAGNSASATVGGINIDKTAPTLSPSVSPNPVVLNGTATASPNASDTLSGIASASCGAVDTSSVGSKSVSCTASDNAGNINSASASYSVQYGFAGFFAPVDNSGVLNVAKAGQAIPLKWRLLDANNNPVTNLASVGVTVASLSCSAGTTVDQVEEYAAGSSGLQNLGDGYYQFNWKSPTTYANSCKTLNLNLGEGSPRTALFQFKK